MNPKAKQLGPFKVRVPSTNSISPENRECGETFINGGGGGGGNESFPLLLLLLSASLNVKQSIYISSISLLNTYCSCHNTKNKVCRFPTCFSRQFIIPHQSIIFNSERKMPTRRRSTCCPSNACVVNQISLNMLTEMDHLAAAGIEVTVTKEPCSRVRLSVKVHPAVIEECYTTVLTVFASVTKVPGFRQKVPTKRLINHVGESSFWWHINNVILKWTFPHAMSSLTERVLKESACIIPKSFRHDYFRYDVVVDVVPEVKWNPENGYKNLNVIVEVDTDIDAQMACEAEIKCLHKALGSRTIVTDRGLQVRKSLLERFKFSEAVHKELATDQAILNQLCKMVEVDIPQFLFEQQGMRAMRLFGLALLQENLEPNEEQLKYMRKYITNLVNLKLAVEDIISRENLQIPALNDFVRSNMQVYGLMKDQVTDSLKDTIRMKAVVDFLRKHASIQYVSKGQRETIEYK